MNSLPRVLCVDDEPLLLAGLSAALHGRYEVTTARSGPEALRRLFECGPFAVVVADLKMPDMDGIRFLSQVRDMAPDTVRILLTGHADLDSAIGAVNQGYIFRFLKKPCPTEVLLMALEDGVNQARLVTRDRELLEKRLEAMSGQLLHAERLATLGTLAGAVGHELNNILVAFDGALNGVAENTRLTRSAEPEDVAVLAQVREHLAMHAKQLLHLGRPTRSDGVRSDLCRTVSETLAMLRSAGLLRHVDVRLKIRSQPVEVSVDPLRLEQVVLNLVKNAVDAMAEERGRAPVLTVEVELDEDGQAARVRISDNGCGIPKDKLGLIFEPYFTTKPPDRGTGLGLFIVKQIIEASHGRLTVDSEVGRGTSITLSFPPCEAKGQGLLESAPARPERPGAAEGRSRP